MSAIIFDCDVTEFNITPKKENDENSFAINEKCLIINIMDTRNDKILIQTEIEKPVDKRETLKKYQHYLKEAVDALPYFTPEKIIKYIEDETTFRK